MRSHAKSCKMKILSESIAPSLDSSWWRWAGPLSPSASPANTQNPFKPELSKDQRWETKKLKVSRKNLCDQRPTQSGFVPQRVLILTRYPHEFSVLGNCPTPYWLLPRAFDSEPKLVAVCDEASCLLWMLSNPKLRWSITKIKDKEQRATSGKGRLVFLGGVYRTTTIKDRVVLKHIFQHRVWWCT